MGRRRSESVRHVRVEIDNLDLPTSFNWGEHLGVSINKADTKLEN